MLKVLKVDTGISIQLGPFVDKTDGLTEEVGLAGTMQVYISKNGGLFALRSSVGAITHDTSRSGWYIIPLDAADVDEVGRLQIAVQDSTTHLPVWDAYQTVSANTYDSLVADTDLLDINIATFESVLNQLVAAHEAGTLVPPTPAVAENTLTLYRQNSYTDLTFTLGPEWSAYLGAGFEAFLTAKRWYTDPIASAIFDVQGTISDIPTGTILVDLSTSDTDHEAGEYWWQMLLKKTDNSVLKVAMAGKLDLLPLVKM